MKRLKTDASLEVILHIGSTKTGSSTLQRLLYANRKALKARGVLYPEEGTASNAHHALFAAVHPGAWRMHIDAYEIPRDAYFENNIKSILNRARELGCPKIILSSEYLWGEFKAEFYQKIRNALVGCRVGIFACFREPEQWRESTYLQALKSGETRSFPEWLAATSAMPHRGFNFEAVMNKWVDHLGAEKSIRIPYIFDNENEFISKVFLELTGEKLLKMPEKGKNVHANRSPTRTGMLRILSINRGGLSEPLRRKYIERVMHTHSRPPNSQELYFSPSVLEQMELGPSNQRANRVLNCMNRLESGDAEAEEDNMFPVLLDSELVNFVNGRWEITEAGRSFMNDV